MILHFIRYRQIAAGSPQWPQAFYPMKKINTVEPGEVVTARYVASYPYFFSPWIFLIRCSYNSTGVNHETHIGGTAGDEMCNLYIMYFTGKLCTIIQLLVLSGALYVAITMGQTCIGHLCYHVTYSNATVSYLSL